MKKPLALALLLSIALPAFPWGRGGHRLVALVAADHLSPVAAENVKYLLGPDTMADIASFADDYRSVHPETAPWHFVDIPGIEKSYVRERDCPAPLVNGLTDTKAKWRDCAVDRILYFAAQLKSPETPKAEKIFDLKMLIHIVGDLHQPFHAMGDSRGGNSINVREFGTTQCGERQACNLHATWDTGLIDHRRLSEKAYLALLEQQITDLKLAAKPDGTPVAWANASHRAAVEALVVNGTLIDQQYFDEEIPVVDRELETGGLHLAHLLDSIFTAPPPQAEPVIKPGAGAQPKLIPREHPQ